MEASALEPAAVMGALKALAALPLLLFLPLVLLSLLGPLRGCARARGRGR
jgi:hypothetical protein